MNRARRLLHRLAVLLAWLAEDADRIWADAEPAHVYAENQRRQQTGGRPLP